MKANFALSLTFEGIRLLHRAAGGWRSVGEVSLETPDLRGALAELRKAALALEPNGLRTKLILPNSQIKYLTIDTNGREGEGLQAAAKTALDGATPYPVNDLAFDLSPDGETTHIAAVAHETLAEAEGFAVEHDFTPVSVVAIPGDEPFLGEPFFGATEHASSVLASGEIVEPDGIAVVVIGDVESQPETPVVDIEVSESTENPEVMVARDEPGEEDIPTGPIPGFSSRRSSGATSTPTLGGVSRRLDLTGAGPGKEQAPTNADNPPVAGNAQDISEEEVQGGKIVAMSTESPTADAAPTFTPTPRMPAEITPIKVPRPATEREQMTIFGARRDGEDAPEISAPPRKIGMAAAAVALVLLAGVASWAAIFQDGGISRFFSPQEPDIPEISAEETSPDTILPETDTFEPQELETASIDPSLLPEESGPEILINPEVPRAFDPEEAEAHYAVTGVWAVPPLVPAPPGLMPLDDLYITSVDPENQSLDPVTLAPDQDFKTDATMLAPPNPAPAGTEFVLDERGFVVPTKDGAVTPDGVTVFAGKPAAVPPKVPLRFSEDPGVAPETRSELAAFRPRIRPDGLTERNERRQLGGLSRSELGEIRPRVRPRTQQEEAEEDEPASVAALAVSPRPRARPQNFARLVERARKSGDRPSKKTTPEAEVASVAPATVKPRVPTKTTVAKEATVRNAINLKRINLMGVYGTPSNRRALVRLSNGRYKKVKVGDRIDGGRVSAIGDSELRYQKGGRNVVLKMPRT